MEDVPAPAVSWGGDAFAGGGCGKGADESAGGQPAVIEPKRPFFSSFGPAAK
jgi:hypothetical protein